MTRPDLKFPGVLDEYTDRVIGALKEIHRLTNDEKPSGHPDYNRELVRGRLLYAWSPRPWERSE